MYQNEEAVGKLFFAPLSRALRRTPFYLSPVTNNKVGLRPPTSCTLPSFYEPLFLRERSWEETGLFAGDVNPLRCSTPAEEGK